MMKKLMILLLMISLSPSVMAFSNSSIVIQDKYGNYNGSIRKVPNTRTYNQTDRNGNHVRTYRQIGNMVYIYDKNGNCVGSYRK